MSESKQAVTGGEYEGLRLANAIRIVRQKTASGKH
jgi:hypothetical protein